MRPLAITAIGTLLLAALLSGCADQPRQEKPATKDGKGEWSEKQEKILDDPMNYRPDMNRTDVSGGGISDFDRRGFKDDMKAWTLD